jgi:hypothetical protein
MPTKFDKTPMPDVLLLELRIRLLVATTMLLPQTLNPRLLQLARRPRHKLRRERRKKR